MTVLSPVFYGTTKEFDARFMAAYRPECPADIEVGGLKALNRIQATSSDEFVRDQIAIALSTCADTDYDEAANHIAGVGIATRAEVDALFAKGVAILEG